MSSYNSEVQISNYALSHLGSSSRITSLREDSVAAGLANLFYPQARDTLLEDHDWNFARQHATLTRISSLTHTPPINWTYAYSYPSAAISIRQLYDENSIKNSDTRRISYEVSTYGLSGNTVGVIYTNLDEARCIYTKAVTDPTSFPASFVDALAFKLAALICMSLTGDAGLKERMEQAYLVTSSRAARQNNNQGVNTTDWFTAAQIEARG